MTKSDDFDNGGAAPAKGNPSLRTKEELVAAADALTTEHGSPPKPLVHRSKEEFFEKLEAFRTEHGRLPGDAELAAALGVARTTIINYKRRYGVSLPRKPNPVLFTKDELAAMIDAFAAEHGRPPYIRELAAVLGASKETASAYCRKYGIRLPRMSPPPIVTKETLVAAVDAFTAEHGRLPSRRELIAVLGISKYTLQYYLHKYGISIPRTPSLFLAKKEVVAAVDALTAEHGRLPSRSELAAALGVSTYKAGLYLRKYGVSLSVKLTAPRRTKEEIFAAADAFAAEHGRQPTVPELAAVLDMGQSTADRYCRRYGVSISRKPSRIRLTKEAFVGSADAFAACHGRPPTASELAAALGISDKAVSRYRYKYGVSLYRKTRPLRFTKEELAAAIDALTAEHGRLPTRRELAAVFGIPTYLLHYYLHKYGVELPPKVIEPLLLTKEKFVAAVDALTDEYGSPPDSAELAAALGVRRNTVSAYCREYGVSLYRKTMPLRFTKEELAAAIDALTAEHGRLPTRCELAAALGILERDVNRYRYKYGVKLTRMSRTARLTKEEVVEKAAAFADEHGRPPTREKLAAVLGMEKDAADRYRRIYGISIQRIRAASVRRLAKEEFVGSVDAFAAEHGRPPTYVELAAVLGIPDMSVNRYRYKYGVKLTRMPKAVRRTKEWFVAAVDAFAAEHGRLPYLNELTAALGLGNGAVYRYCHLFGVSILRMRTKNRLTKEAFEAARNAFAAEHGRPPYIRELAALLGISRSTVINYLREYGIPSARKPALITKEAFVASRDAFAAEHGRQPDSAELAAVLGVHRSTVNVYCRKYDVRLLVRPAEARYTKEAFVAKTAAFAAEHGRQPYLHELAALLGVDRHTVRKYCRKYGVKLPRKPLSYGLTREHVVAAAGAFAAEHGRQPYIRELAAVLGVHRATANHYRIKFGLDIPRPPRGRPAATASQRTSLPQR
jgi:DNA-directed RNA polymerase specialized sigma subunit